MDTALITGMLEMKVLPEKRVEKDVKQLDGSGFSDLFEKSLKSQDVKNKEVESNQLISKKEQKVDNEEVSNKEVESKEVDNEEVSNKEVENKEVENKEVDNEEVDNEEVENKEVENKESNEVEENKDKKDKGKKSIKITDKKQELVLDQNSDVLSNKNVENTESINEDDVLNGLLEKIDVEPESIVNIKDESENVIKVGPQLVETEKIKLNIKDVESKFKELVENKVVELEENLDSNQEQAVFDLERLERMLNDKGVKGNEIANINVSVKKNDKENMEEVFDNVIIKNKDVLKNSKKDVQELEEGSFNEKVVDNTGEKNNNLNEGSLTKEDFTGKDGEKDNKLKIKDVNKKESNSFLERIMEETDVKIEDKFNIKEVANIQKFENMDIEQIDILDQVTEKLEVSLLDNKSEMVIKLKPNDLGNVTVKISIENGVMNAKFLADSIKVKETLESSLNNLKESLKDQGLNVQNLSVSVDSGRSQNQNFEQNNLIYLNNRRDYRINDSVGYEEEYYEMADINRNVSNSQLMGSTVSFLA